MNDDFFRLPLGAVGQVVRRLGHGYPRRRLRHHPRRVPGALRRRRMDLAEPPFWVILSSSRRGWGIACAVQGVGTRRRHSRRTAS